MNHIGIEQIPIIQKIAHQTWPNTFGQVMTPEQIQYMLGLIYNEASLKSQIIEKGHKFILVEKDNIPLGFTSYEINYKGESKLMIHKIYLLPQSQGLGIGTNLINLLSKIALDNNNKKLQLKVFYKNDKAIGFYEKYGFKQNGIEETNIGNNYIILDKVMERDLIQK
jgi:ribosomal protein S18 acetylase RimI-like enzyme